MNKQQWPEAAEYIEQLTTALAPVFSDLFLKSLAEAAALLPLPNGEAVLSRLVADAKLESPIEAVFYMHWWVAKTRQDSPEIMRLDLVAQFPLPVEGHELRPDFLILPRTRDSKKGGEALHRRLVVAVELDGHEFHERTKEQVAHRNARDRALQRFGLRVCHFSGSEVVRNPILCVREAVESAVAFNLLELAD